MIFSRSFVAVFSAATMLLAPAATFAQPAPAPPAAAGPSTTQQHHHRRGSAYMRALRTLDLSDAQRTQIAGIVDRARAANKNADPASRRAGREKLRAEIDAVLTPAQRTRLRDTLARNRTNAPART